MCNYKQIPVYAHNNDMIPIPIHNGLEISDCFGWISCLLKGISSWCPFRFCNFPFIRFQWCVNFSPIMFIHFFLPRTCWGTETNCFCCLPFQHCFRRVSTPSDFLILSLAGAIQKSCCCPVGWKVPHSFTQPQKNSSVWKTKKGKTSISETSSKKKHKWIWVFPKIGILYPKMDGWLMANPIFQWMIWEENPLFLETSIWHSPLDISISILFFSACDSARSCATSPWRRCWRVEGPFPHDL